VVGENAEYSAGRFKLMGGGGPQPLGFPQVAEDLETRAFYLEGNYTLRSRLRFVLRYNGLRIARINDGPGPGPGPPGTTTWTAGRGAELFPVRGGTGQAGLAAHTRCTPGAVSKTAVTYPGVTVNLHPLCPALLLALPFVHLTGIVEA